MQYCRLFALSYIISQHKCAVNADVAYKSQRWNECTPAKSISDNVSAYQRIISRAI